MNELEKLKNVPVACPSCNNNDNITVDYMIKYDHITKSNYNLQIYSSLMHEVFICNSCKYHFKYQLGYSVDINGKYSILSSNKISEEFFYITVNDKEYTIALNYLQLDTTNIGVYCDGMLVGKLEGVDIRDRVAVDKAFKIWKVFQ